MSHPNVRRLTAAALLLVLAAAPALAAPAGQPHAPRVPAITGVTLFDPFLDWIGLPAAGPPPAARSMHEKSGSGSPSWLIGLLELLGLSEDRGVLIDPNG